MCGMNFCVEYFNRVIVVKKIFSVQSLVWKMIRRWVKFVFHFDLILHG